MGKKCVSCEENDALYCVKGTSECYCEECAVEHFGDLDLLTKVEDEAKALKQFVESKVSVDVNEDGELVDDVKNKNDVLDVDDLIDVKIKGRKTKKKVDSKKTDSDDVSEEDLIDIKIHDHDE